MKNNRNKKKDISEATVKPRRKKVVADEELSAPTGQIVRLKSGVDRPFLLIVIILLCIGTTMVFSASYAYAKENFNDSYYFSKRQIIWAAASIAIMFLVSRVDYLLIKRFVKPFFIASLILLALVPIIGYDSGGAKRWLSLGFVNLQPSELVKAAIVIMFADYAVRNQKRLHTVKYGIMYYGLWAGVVCAFLYLQPHLSGMIIMLTLTAIMMYAGGSRPKHLAIVSAFGVVALTVLIFFMSHGKSRINIWLHPDLDPSGKGWQPLQSLYAIGSGGFWGVGLGQSRQKHLYLPEPQNDYIFAILCEEMGYIFAVAVLALFMILIWRGFYIARNAPSRFASLVVIGLVSQVAIQVLLNIAVVTNAIPSTGISLPFFSYGGTSLMIFMAEMGIVLNISRYSYIEKS